MASFDDEAEPLPVTNYYFEDENDEPISVHVLSIEWGKDKRHEGMKQQIYLRGTADNGLEKIHCPVIAWKFDLHSVKPVISVQHSNGKKWIVLWGPRKSFEKIIVPVLVTLYCLSHVIKNPESSTRTMWQYIADMCSVYEVKPSPDDLVEHMSLISEAVKMEGALKKSKFIVNFLEEGPTKRKLPDKDIQIRRKPRLSSTDDLFDTVCVFCDNGGDLLCCEGRCLRAFHATVKDGEDYACVSLGFTQDKVEEIRKTDFYCKNCQYKQHQCYVCGNLGSSDKFSDAEVFPCTFSWCGHFYHPHCIANLNHHETGVSAQELEERIKQGESFTCPIHKCCSCKQVEDKKDRELQFAVCRRCPTSYHRKCLPRDIPFAKGKDEEDNARAWEGLLPDRVLIYCTKHKIDKTLRTPIRDHVKFPDVSDTEIAVEKKTSFQEKKRRLTSQSRVISENPVSRRKRLYSDRLHEEEYAPTTLSQPVGETSVSMSTRLSSEGLHKEQNAGTTMSQLISAAWAVKDKRKSATVESSSRQSISCHLGFSATRMRQVDLTIKLMENCSGYTVISSGRHYWTSML